MKQSIAVFFLSSFLLSNTYARGQNEDTFMHTSPRIHTGSDIGHDENQGNQTFMHNVPGPVGTDKGGKGGHKFMNDFNGQKQGTDVQGGESQSTDTFLHNPNGLQTGTENTR